MDTGRATDGKQVGMRMLWVVVKVRLRVRVKLA